MVSIPLMSTPHRQQLDKIWRQFEKNRGSASMDAMLMAYQPLVEKAAKQLKSRLPRLVDIDDLTQEGLLGLRRAIERFDRKRNIKFTSFAGWHISGAMLDSLRGSTWEPRLVLTRSRQVDTVIRQFTMIHGRKPSEDELADSLGLSASKLQAVLKDSRRVTQTSLTAQRFTSGSDRGSSVADLQPDKQAPDPTQLAQANDLRDLITRGFTRAERLILILYYYENMSMREIGLTLDLSESRVSQMHKSIVKQLKVRLLDKKKEFLPPTEDD